MLLEKELVYSKEKLYFTLVVIASIVIYIAFLISIIGIIFLAIGLVIYWLLHTYSLMSIRKNGVRISEQQFPAFYEKAKQLTNDMGMDTVPNIYVVQAGGILNAFATKFGFKNMVVLYADIFSLIEEGAEDEVLYILAHEFAHVKRRHVGYSWLLMPGLSVPFLSSAYSRACEFTCDRYGAAYTNSYEGAKNALTILAVGPQLYKKVNKSAFVAQINEENGAFSWIDEIMSTHPNLPRRIHALDAYFNPEGAQVVKSNVRGMVTGLVLFIAFTALLIFGSIYTFTKIDEWASTFDEYASTDDIEYYNTGSLNDLMLAVIDNDLDAVALFATDYEQLHAVNEDGYTALHLAVLEQNLEALDILLQAGANPETMDAYSYTPLMDAVLYDFIESAEVLLQYGASPENIEAAIAVAEENGDGTFIELLQQYLP